MSDDLKDRLQRTLRTKLVSDLDETRDALARIEQLEAQVDTLQTAMTAPTQDEIDLRSKLASSQAEALAAHAEVIRTQDEIGELLHHAEAQLAAVREALEAVRFNLLRAGYATNSIMIEGIDVALATAPATDGEKMPRVNRLVHRRRFGRWAAWQGKGLKP